MSVCLSVSQSVIQYVNLVSHITSWTLYRSQSSTHVHHTCRQCRESQERWRPIVFGGNLKYFCPPYTPKPCFGRTSNLSQWTAFQR